MSEIDVAAVRAIDVHVHAEVSRAGHDPMPPELRAAAQRYFRDGGGTPTIDDVAAHYRERQMACVVFTVDWGPNNDRPAVPNEEIAEGAAANADVMIPFASVHPAWPDAADRARRLIRDHGVRGFKLDEVSFYCARSNHGHLPNKYGIEMQMDAFIDTLDAVWRYDFSTRELPGHGLKASGSSP